MHTHRHHEGASAAHGSWISRHLGHTVAGGVLALLWLILRSGTKPSRLSYPCQRAAMGTASAAFGIPIVAAVVALRRRLGLGSRRAALMTAASTGLLLTAGLTIYLAHAAYHGPVLSPPRDYRAQLYHVTSCPQDTAGDHFLGLSNLLGVMGRGGLKFYKSSTASPVAGPDGIVAANDVVVIKINYQWDERGGTNTDVLRGLIRCIVNHPDGFTGEVVVCENAQFNSADGFDRPLNNAQDHALSPHRVVVGFQQLGYNVSQYDWTSIRTVQVNEYSSGDMNDGYIVGSYNSNYQGKLSYAKFRSAAGTDISIRYGVWDPVKHTYDRSRLKFINVPVLKSHHATYGATASTKHYMGVVTDQFSTNSHAGIHYGIMGALMGEIQMADLNIIDAIWINANPNSGPSTTYDGATRRDELVAGRDPIALDIWAVKNILVPGFISNGYSPPWPSPSADPDLPTSAFREYLDNSMSQLLAAGYTVTNNLNQIDVMSGKGGAGDFDGNGTVDMADFARFSACFTGYNGGPVGPECAAGDFDGDGDVDCDDWHLFQFVWTSTDPIPAFDPCGPAGVPGEAGRDSASWLRTPAPNPAGGSCAIQYSVKNAGLVRLGVFDVAGRPVRLLVDRFENAGDHVAPWDGRDLAGHLVGPGVYLARLEAGGTTRAVKIVRR